MPIDQASQRGMTALHIAVLSGKREAVEYLLQNKADPSKRSVGTIGDAESFTAPGWAQRMGQKEIEDLLRKHGVKE